MYFGLFLKGVYDVFGEEAAQKSCVEFSIGHGYYVNTHDIPNKRLIPLSYLESHETIITISLQDWITLFKNIHTAMKYVNNYNDEEINKLKKDFAFLNVYYFIILTGGNN